MRSSKANARRQRILDAMRRWRLLERGPEGQYCFNCSARESDVLFGLAVHHMVRRSRAPKLVADPRNFILLCRVCHELADERPGELTLADQLLLKQTHDPDYYDAEVILEYAR